MVYIHVYIYIYIYIYIYRRLGGERNRQIVSFRCVLAGEAKLRERVRASVSLLAGLANRIRLAGPCRAVVPFVPADILFFCEVYVVLVDALGPRDHFAHVLFSPRRFFVRVLWVPALLERGLAPRRFSPLRFLT